MYEEIGMYEAAGETRAMDKEIKIKRTEVSVDLNRLLQEIKDGGIVAIYKCPHCNGKLKIGKDTTVKNLAVCEHCGNGIQTVELTDFLKDILS